MSENKITFGKIFWPSLLAIFIMSIIGLFIFVLIIGGIIGSFGEFGPKPLSIKNNTVLHMTLNGEIAEKSSSTFDPTSFNLNRTIGLSDLLFGIETAKNDEKVKGIFLEVGDLNCGYSSTREIRQALIDFKSSGKFIVAYNAGEVITQKEYYLSSVANEVYAFPSSAMEFFGLGAELMYFKNTLDKLDVEVEIIRGSNNDFKSAVEPFFRTDMSDSSRVQIERYLTSMWEDIRQDISTERQVSILKLNDIAENASIRRANDAVKLKLIDGVMYRDEVIDLISKKIGLDQGEEPEFQAFEKYARKKFYSEQTLTKKDDPNIAVILAEGEISTDGDGLSSKEICKLFQAVRKNSSIKTVVFRVNSPGGSALASDEIWREVVLTNKTKKVIVSMGDVAASGGYYVSAPGTMIFAEPTTITGSIGVFGMIPYIGKMLENKLGITFDRAGTNAHSIMSLMKKLTPEELKMIQEEVDYTYMEFLNRVSVGRNLSVEQVNMIARGRVWTGRDALEIGLVDRLGGLYDAIQFASKKAGIKDKKVLYYPLKEEDMWQELLEDYEEDNGNLVMTRSKLPEVLSSSYESLLRMSNRFGIQMRLPYEITIH